jgi:hypothetical protein
LIIPSDRARALRYHPYSQPGYSVDSAIRWAWLHGGSGTYLDSQTLDASRCSTSESSLVV